MPKKSSTPWWKTLDSDDVRTAFEEATVDCYGDDEVFSGLIEMAIQEIQLPARGRVLGLDVELIELNYASDSPRDVDFVCKHNGEQFNIAARSVEFVDELPDGHLFLAALMDYQSRL